ncbi:MAG: 50S ribosomal protein L25/general stress protein Ctc [Alphaproteobacteria bacterium]
MAETSVIEAQVRARAGKGAARAARRAGSVPGVIYGDKKDPVMISIDGMLFTQELHKPGFFARQYDIEVGGEKHHVLPRDVQFHPVTDKPIHVDFLRVGADTQIRMNVPVVFENEAASPGLKRGGVLNIVRHTIEVICTVANIPERFRVDLTGLDIGDSVHISHVTLPPGVRPTIADRDFTVASVAAPTIVAVEEVAAAAAAVPTEGEAVEVPATEQKVPPTEEKT